MKRTITAVLLALCLALLHDTHLLPIAHAQIFDGPGFKQGIAAVGGILGIPTDLSLWNLILHIIVFILNFVSLIAVIVVIVAGIRLIVSMGEDEQKEKAKKSIINMAIGLVIIILSRVIVAFIVNLARGNVS